MAIGVGKPCTGKEKNAGCCPPAQGNTACATLPGNFPLVGQVDVCLNNKGQALFDVQVGLALKGIFEATGALEIEADPQSGVNLNSLVFTIPEAGLEGIFTVKKAKFAYYFPSAPDESKRDTWQAEGEIIFGPLGEPSLEAELAFKKGQFHSGSLVFQAPPPGIPIYPGIFLNKLGGSIGVEPFAFGGVLGAKVAAALELTLSFKYREATDQELGFFGGQGQLELDDDKIATLAADVYSDGYVDAQLSIDLHLPFSSDNPIVKVGGTIGFWDESKSGLWQAEGSVYLKLWEISAEVAGLVNNHYIAGCLAAGGFGVQGRYSFSDGSIGGGLLRLQQLLGPAQAVQAEAARQTLRRLRRRRIAAIPARRDGSGAARRRAARRSRSIERDGPRGGRGRRHVHPARRSACAGAAVHLELGDAGGNADRSRRADLHHAGGRRSHRHVGRPVHRGRGPRRPSGARHAQAPRGGHLARADSARVAASFKARSGI